MPITHERLSAILTSAQHFRQSFIQLKETIQVISESQITPEQFYMEVTALVQRSGLSVDAQVLIELESQKLAKNAARNEKEKLRQRLRRSNEAMPKQAPISYEEAVARAAKALDQELPSAILPTLGLKSCPSLSNE